MSVRLALALLKFYKVRGRPRRHAPAPPPPPPPPPPPQPPLRRRPPAAPRGAAGAGAWLTRPWLAEGDLAAAAPVLSVRPHLQRVRHGGVPGVRGVERRRPDGLPFGAVRPLGWVRLRPPRVAP